MSERVDLIEPIERGDTFALRCVWADSNGAMDMRGKTIIFTMKLSPFMEDAEAVLKVEVVPEANDTLAQAGTVNIVIPKSQSANLIAGAIHHYALRSIEPGYPEPVEITYAYGEVRVKDS